MSEEIESARLILVVLFRILFLDASACPQFELSMFMFITVFPSPLVAVGLTVDSKNCLLTFEGLASDLKDLLAFLLPSLEVV